MMHQKLLTFFENFIVLSRKNPFEIIIIMSGVILSIAQVYKTHTLYFISYADGELIDYRLAYFPIVFLLTSMINQLTFKMRRYQWLYFIAGAFFALLFLLVNIKPNNTYYIVGLICIILAYPSHSLYRDNTQFAKCIFDIIMVLIPAGFITFVVNIILLSIAKLIHYLFVGGGDGLKIINYYITSIIWVSCFSLLFLGFIHKPLKLNIQNRFNHIVFNYIWTPAIIIYGIIFYAYCIKIIVLWELPKGKIAYMVFVFSWIAYILKLFSYLFAKKYALLLYRKIPYLILPSLVLFWVGALHRINEYGFTESRVYLSFGALYITIISFVLLREKWIKFIYILLGIIPILCIFTYLPFMSAKQWGLISQQNRFVQSANILGLQQLDSTIILKDLSPTEDNKKNIRILYESFKYINKERGEVYTIQKYAIRNMSQLKQIINPQNYAMAFHDEKED